MTLAVCPLAALRGCSVFDAGVVWAAVNAAISSMAAAARPLRTYEWLFMNDLFRAAPLPAKWRRKISDDPMQEHLDT